jgi:SOS-response transcriptional repressors (RecA-mediated autopeptidases)
MVDTMGKKIKTLRETYEYSQGQLAIKIQVSRSLISLWESDNRKPGYNELQKLADLFDVTTDYLLGKTTVPNGEVISSSLYDYKIPILGTAPCGEAIEAIENIIGYIDVPKKMADNHFALKASGDSMFPEIKNGDTLIVHQSPIVDSGKIAIVKINGEEATCKKILINESGITLIPLNNRYDVTQYTPKDVKKLPITIIGEVVEIRRKL